jgi:hypothetical protein
LVFVRDQALIVFHFLVANVLTQPSLSKATYVNLSEKTELLRYFRDNILSKTREGQEIIKLYYQRSPIMVEMMKEDEEFKEEVKDLINEVLLFIE